MATPTGEKVMHYCVY